MTATLAPEAHVQETRFGQWFLHTEIWTEHVLERAIDDLATLAPQPQSRYPVIVDVGCGWGRSFKLLRDRFRPDRMIGIDIDPEMLTAAAAEVAGQGIEVTFQRASLSRLPLPDGSADMILCHQTFHHLVDQHAALGEFHRVLKPGGVLLFAESTRKYIHSWIIRLLFRHPMEVQRSAEEYLEMVRAAGFAVGPDAISYPYLWWSRNDLGILERWFGIAPSPGREETLINLVAIRT
jgi:ubiquinone/menaquinone biosynthesis C-methylase UbiE